MDAVEFLWSSAPKLQTLRISGTVLLTTTATSAVPHEAIFNERRVRKVFGKAGAGAEDSSLRVLEIPMSFDSIESATLFLKSLPSSVETVRMLCVQVKTK